MIKKMGYRWQLRHRMAEQGMFQTSDRRCHVVGWAVSEPGSTGLTSVDNFSGNEEEPCDLR